MLTEPTPDSYFLIRSFTTVSVLLYHVKEDKIKRPISYLQSSTVSRNGIHAVKVWYRNEARLSNHSPSEHLTACMHCEETVGPIHANMSHLWLLRYVLHNTHSVKETGEFDQSRPGFTLGNDCSVVHC